MSMRCDIKNETGKRYGKLLVISIAKSPRRGAFWLCQCDCKEKIIVYGGHLRSGSRTSCGCYAGRFKHGMSHTPLYAIYSHIRQRCDNKKSQDYKNYGGRGIKCKWKNFEEFYKDIGNTYHKGMSIDRIDNNGNYSKKNCHWATHKQQANNMRSNVFLEYKGQRLTVQQWAEKLNMNYWTLIRRITRGWEPERALTCPIFNRGQYIS